MVPGSRQLVGDTNGLVLRGDLDGHAVARLGRPAFDLDLLNVLAFGARPRGGLLADDLVGRKVVEVGSQASVHEVLKWGLGAEVSIQTLEHDLVAGERGALQVFISAAHGDPALSRIEKRSELAGLVAVLDFAGQLA